MKKRFLFLAVAVFFCLIETSFVSAQNIGPSGTASCVGCANVGFANDNNLATQTSNSASAVWSVGVGFSAGQLENQNIVNISVNFNGFGGTGGHTVWVYCNTTRVGSVNLTADAREIRNITNINQRCHTVNLSVEDAAGNNEEIGVFELQPFNGTGPVAPTPINLTATATDLYDGSTLSNFSLSIMRGSTVILNQTTNNGTIPISNITNGMANLTFQSENYFESSFFNVNVSGQNFVGNLTGGWIFSENRDFMDNLLNSSIYLNSSNRESNNSRIKLGVWNITSSVRGFFNNSAFLSIGGRSNFTFFFNNSYNGIVLLRDSVSGLELPYNCSVNSNYSRANGKYLLLQNGSNNVNCSVATHGSGNITFNWNGSTALAGEINLTPAQLIVSFSENTSGYVSWPSQFNGTDGFYFNNTNLLYNQRDIASGYVTITFNNGQQLYEYYNDNSTTINVFLKIITPDLVQKVRCWDGTQIVEGRVEVYTLVNRTFYPFFATFTNKEGEANILVKDSETYKFVCTNDEYSAGVELKYVVPSNTDIITITLSPLVSSDESITISSTCDWVLRENENCTLSVADSSGSHVWGINTTINGVSTFYTSASLNSYSVLFEARNDSTSSHHVDIYKDGDFVQSVEYRMNSLTAGKRNIGFQESDKSWVYDFIIEFVVILLVVSGALGFMVEQRFEGWGLKTMAIFMCIGGGYILNVFYGIALLLAAWWAYDEFSPQTSG